MTLRTKFNAWLRTQNRAKPPGPFQAWRAGRHEALSEAANKLYDRRLFKATNILCFMIDDDLNEEGE